MEPQTYIKDKYTQIHTNTHNNSTIMNNKTTGGITITDFQLYYIIVGMKTAWYYY